MNGQMKANRIIDSLAQKYNADHDIGVDFAWVDSELLELCKAQQAQIEELANRIYALEHPNYMEER